MGIPIGQTTTVTMSGVAFRGVTCEHCEHRFGYPLGRSVAGQGFSFMFLDNGGAGDRATDSAGSQLEKKLKEDVEVYRCPQCGFFDPSMFRLIQSKFYIWLAACAVIAFLAGVAVIIVAIVQLGARHDGLPAWSILGGIAGTLVCVILVAIRMLLTEQIDPNEDEYRSMLMGKYPDGYEAQVCRERIQIAESIYVAELRTDRNILSAGVIPHDGLIKVMALLTKPSEETKSTSRKRRAENREKRSEHVEDRRRSAKDEGFPQFEAAGIAKSPKRGSRETSDLPSQGSSGSTFDTAFQVQMNSTWTFDRNYRVYVTGTNLLFVRIGGQGLGQHFAIHFGLLGALLFAWSQKNAAKKKEQLIREYDQQTAEELLAAHKHNFQVNGKDIEVCTIEPTSLFHGHGPAAGFWKLHLWDSQKFTLQFGMVDEMRAALKSLPTVCPAVYSCNVEWNKTKKQYQKKMS